jgi:hypothetical protein
MIMVVKMNLSEDLPECRTMTAHGFVKLLTMAADGELGVLENLAEILGDAVDHLIKQDKGNAAVWAGEVADELEQVVG